MACLLHSVALRHPLWEQEAEVDSTRGANESLALRCLEPGLPFDFANVAYADSRSPDICGLRFLSLTFEGHSYFTHSASVPND